MPWVSLGLAIMISLIALRRVKWILTGLGTPLAISGFCSSIPWIWLLLNSSSLANQFVIFSGFEVMFKSSKLIYQIVQDVLFSASKAALTFSVGAIFLGLVLLAFGLMVKTRD